MFMLFNTWFMIIFKCNMTQYIGQLCEKGLSRNFRKHQILLMATDHYHVKAISYFATILKHCLYKSWSECLHKSKKANEKDIRYFVLSLR